MAVSNQFHIGIWCGRERIDAARGLSHPAEYRFPELRVANSKPRQHRPSRDAATPVQCLFNVHEAMMPPGGDAVGFLLAYVDNSASRRAVFWRTSVLKTPDLRDRYRHKEPKRCVT
ncbi:hypothetical protein GCM10023063_47420 [Arthrobacter methylotrophus]